MNILALVYLILVIVTFNILYHGGYYRKCYIMVCKRNRIQFALASTVVTATGPIWLMIGIIEGLTGQRK